MAARGVGSCSELGEGGTINHQDTFVWRKSHSYGVTVKTGGAPVLLATLLPTPMNVMIFPTKIV